MLSVCESRH
uniref:Uncharacterized protein n=1 Tax=Arundo donax TaxID=35708 RepID=A0A0A9ELB9_ARUDO